MSRNTDFYINFNVHPVTGDLALLQDAASISQAIKNIVFTNPYERPFAPLRGAGIPRTLFENIVADTEFLLQTRIEEAIAADEPRATNVIVNVVTDADHNAYNATIYYTPVNTTVQVQVSAVFKRIR